MDYSRTFGEDEKPFCKDHLKNDGFHGLKFGVISYDFTAAVDRQDGKNRKTFPPLYVCNVCKLPSEFYVRFCYYCERDFYGFPGVSKDPNEQCFDCSQKDWSI